MLRSSAAGDACINHPGCQVHLVCGGAASSCVTCGKQMYKVACTPHCYAVRQRFRPEMMHHQVSNGGSLAKPTQQLSRTVVVCKPMTIATGVCNFGRRVCNVTASVESQSTAAKPTCILQRSTGADSLDSAHRLHVSICTLGIFTMHNNPVASASIWALRQTYAVEHISNEESHSTLPLTC
jgi:hypothetical protein